LLGTSDDSEQLRQSEQVIQSVPVRLAATYNAVQGEHIARMIARSNGRSRTGARTLKRLFRPRVRLTGLAEGTKRRLSETPRRRKRLIVRFAAPKRVGGVRVKSWTRSLSVSLSRMKPKGAASDGRANPASGRQGLSEG
jgi:hypothetical protein